MPTKQDYDVALGQLEKPTRVCILYLEKLIDEKFNIALRFQQPVPPRVDLSKIESTLDSLQKQINGMRNKVDAVHSHTQKHHETEIFLKGLVKKADQVLGEVRLLFDELYKSGFFKEGQKRRIRDEGLIP